MLQLSNSSLISLTRFFLPIDQAFGKWLSLLGFSMSASCSSFFGFSSTFKLSSFKTRFYRPAQYHRLNSTAHDMTWVSFSSFFYDIFNLHSLLRTCLLVSFSIYSSLCSVQVHPCRIPSRMPVESLVFLVSFKFSHILYNIYILLCGCNVKEW